MVTSNDVDVRIRVVEYIRFTFRKKEKNEEIAMLTARIIALRRELRRVTGKDSGQFVYSFVQRIHRKCDLIRN